jgi:hypothetical protein
MVGMAASEVDNVMSEGSDDDDPKAWYESDMGFSEIDTSTSDEFNRLRWSVFEDILQIQVADDPYSLTPNLSPFLGHPIALEAATQDPLHLIALVIETIEEQETWSWKECPIITPKPLLVRRADGGIITIGDVVEQLSRYIIKNKDLILLAKGPSIQVTHEVTEGGEHVIGIPADDGAPAPPDTKVVFVGFSGMIEAGFYALPVELWAEGEMGKTLEYFGKSQVDSGQFPI